MELGTFGRWRKYVAYTLADQIHQEAYPTLTHLQACQGHAYRVARNTVEARVCCSAVYVSSPYLEVHPAFRYPTGTMSARNPPFIIGKCQTYPLPLKKFKTKLNPWDTITP